MQAGPLESDFGASGVSGWRSGRWLRFIADRNPFYLLSACFGLVGCWLLGDVSQHDVAAAAMRIGGVFAYELAVVSLGVWLAKRADMQRDAAILSVLALVLVADFSFFYVQAAMLGQTSAALFSLFGAAQSLAVAGALLRGLRVGLSRPAQWLLALDLFAVHLFPLALRLCAEGQASLPLAFLAAFSAAGVLVAAHAWPAQWRTEPAASDSSPRPGNDLARGLAVIAPVVVLASLVTHLIAVEWIYDIRFFGVFASPLCLGVAVLCLRREAARMDTAADVNFDNMPLGYFTPGGWSCVFAVLAVFLAFGNPPPGAVWDANNWSWFGISPLRLTLTAAAAVFWDLWRLRRDKRVLFLACAAATLATLGHTAETMRSHAGDLSRTAIKLLYASFPASRTGWGLLLFVMAFLLLGAGAWVSWWKTRALDASKDDADSVRGNQHE